MGRRGPRRRQFWRNIASSRVTARGGERSGRRRREARLRTVSIIPGIDTGAPERTLTSSGSAVSPKRRPMTVSIAPIPARISSSRPSGQPPARYARQASVEIAKPGGTGRPSSRTSRRGWRPCRRPVTGRERRRARTPRSRRDLLLEGPPDSFGESGRSRITTPVASRTAAATAGATHRARPRSCPSRRTGPSAFSIASLVISSGRSMLVGMR